MCTKNQLDKARKIIINVNSSSDDKSWAYDLIDEWRKSYEEPLNNTYTSLKKILGKSKNYLHISKRLKRFSSIKAKILKNTQMSISRMQDIGGIRVVFNTLKEVYDFRNKILKTKSKVFSVLKNEDGIVKENDYIGVPKPDGYRSIHFVLKYNLDGRRTVIELQLRTILQHLVATTVETLGVIDSANYKGGDGDADRRIFLKGISDLFANNEPGKNYPLNDVNYKLLNDIADKYSIIESLRSLEPFSKQLKDSYIIFTIMEGKSLATPFYDKKLAELYYSTLEKSIDDSIQVFMISTDSIKELKKSYPNWFFDTKDFIEYYNKFIK